MPKLSPSSQGTLKVTASQSPLIQTAFSLDNVDFNLYDSEAPQLTVDERRPISLYNLGSGDQRWTLTNMRVALVGKASGVPPSLSAASFTSLNLYYARNQVKIVVTLKSHQFALVVPLLLR